MVLSRKSFFTYLGDAYDDGDHDLFDELVLKQAEGILEQRALKANVHVYPQVRSESDFESPKSPPPEYPPDSPK